MHVLGTMMRSAVLSVAPLVLLAALVRTTPVNRTTTPAAAPSEPPTDALNSTTSTSNSTTEAHNHTASTTHAPTSNVRLSRSTHTGNGNASTTKLYVDPNSTCSGPPPSNACESIDTFADDSGVNDTACAWRKEKLCDYLRKPTYLDSVKLLERDTGRYCNGSARNGTPFVRGTCHPVNYDTNVLIWEQCFENHNAYRQEVVTVKVGYVCRPPRFHQMG